MEMATDKRIQGQVTSTVSVFLSPRNKLEFILSVVAITVAIIFVATYNGLSDDLGGRRDRARALVVNIGIIFPEHNPR